MSQKSTFVKFKGVGKVTFKPANSLSKSNIPTKAKLREQQFESSEKLKKSLVQVTKTQTLLLTVSKQL